VLTIYLFFYFYPSSPCARPELVEGFERSNPSTSSGRAQRGEFILSLSKGAQRGEFILTVSEEALAKSEPDEGSARKRKLKIENLYQS